MENGEYLIAEVADGGTERTLAFPLVQLPEAERAQCAATLGKSGADEAVQSICSDLQLGFFVHDTKTHIRDSDVIQHSCPADAWLMRDDFLRLKLESETVSSFLNKWGRWIALRNYTDLNEIALLQRAVREALTSSAEKWFGSPYALPPMVQSRTAEFPYFMMLTDACQVGIRMTTTIDLLRELKFKLCARRDCGLPFPIKSKHKRDYCSQYCAHLESVRRSRKTAPTKVDEES